MPTLLFELDDSFKEESGFVINHILVHRISNHNSVGRVGMGPKSILKISEIRALDIDSQNLALNLNSAFTEPPQDRTDSVSMDLIFGTRRAYLAPKQTSCLRRTKASS
jgi:hypothetical protein